MYVCWRGEGEGYARGNRGDGGVPEAIPSPYIKYSCIYCPTIYDVLTIRGMGDSDIFRYHDSKASFLLFICNTLIRVNFKKDTEDFQREIQAS